MSARMSVFPRALSLLLLFIVLPVGALRAEDVPELGAARMALADGLFDVAALKIERLLARPKIPKKIRSEAAALQVEALIRGKRGEEALAVLKDHDIADKPFWLGHAYLLTGEFDQASVAFGNYPSDGPLAALAQLGRVHALVGEGREGAARQLVKQARASSDEVIARHARLYFNELELSTDRSAVVLDRLSRERGGKDATVQFLRARAQMEIGDLKTSEAILRDLQLTGANAMTPLAHDASIVLLAETLWRERLPEARKMLIEFLGSFGNLGKPTTTEYWSEGFALLERMAAEKAEDDALLTPALQWSADGTVPERQGHAFWFAASEMHRRGRDTEAIGFLEALVQQYPQHAKSSEAMRLAMQLHGEQRNDARVLQLAERWREEFGGGGGAVVDFLVGLIQFTRTEYLEALKSFSKAADAEGDLSRRRRALYNAAICALKAGETAAVASVMAQLGQAATEEHGKKVATESAADLELDRALQLASQIDPKAEEELSRFISSQPKHPRWVEANVALAEYCLLDVPPRVKRASEALDAASKTAPPKLLERIGYVRMWLREADFDLAGVAREGQAFLLTWPQSPSVDELQMKVADAYYRQDLFAKARTEFELLVKNHPNSPYADSALFWAGMAAMAQQTDDGFNAAIARWEDLAQREGPLAFTARRQQAVATLRKGDEGNALKLLSGLAEDANASNEDRLSVQCERASLMITMGRKDAAQYEAAVGLMRTVLAEKGLSFTWTARCGVLMATAVRGQKKITEALEACHDVIDIGSNVVSAPQNPSEFLWYYRAGFLAIELLEETQKWEAAARLAERLAQSGGDRAQEAGKRASDIRLKHYLWDR